MATMWIERNGIDLLVEVHGTFKKGTPAVGPSWGHGGMPGDPDTFEDIVATVVGPPEQVGTGERTEDLTEKELDRAIELLSDEC